MIDKTMNKVFKKAADSALLEWGGDFDDATDLVNDLWVWYLERPATQKKFQEIEQYEAVKTAKLAAFQMLSRRTLSSNEFNGRNLYSSDSVKEALRGESKNNYLLDILPIAMEELSRQNEGQTEALRVRYEDQDVPARGSAQEAKLKRAVKSLTEHVNVIAITANMRKDKDGNLIVKEGPGSRNAVFPETRRSTGSGHSDPTADIAIMLIEHPELRDEWIREEPLPKFLGGRSA